MLVVVFAVSVALIGFLLVDPLKQLFYRRRKRRWSSYYRN